MRFDKTDGRPAKYMVAIHSWNYSDFYYFSDIDTAHRFYNTYRTLNASSHHTVKLIDLTLA